MPASLWKAQIRKGGLAAALSSELSSFDGGLDALDVLCLPALRAFHNVELNLLAFLKAAETVGLDGGEVYKYVLAVLAADKPVTLGVVKPLYCSCFHGGAVFLLC
jgi:hypothetical protein